MGLNSRLKSIIFTFGPLYCVAVALLYHSTYWGRFGINILEFSDLTDIVSMAFIPIISAFSGVALGVVAGNILSKNTLGRNRFYSICSLIAFLAALLFGGLGLSAVVLAFLIQIYVFKNNISYEELFSSASVRNGIYSFLVIILAMSYAQGGLNADRIIEGKKYMYASVNGQIGRFAGHAGNNIFFYSDEKKVLIVYRLPEGESLNFSYYPKPPGDHKTLFEKYFLGAEILDSDQSSKMSNKASKGTQ